jgi:hypothetical protein
LIPSSVPSRTEEVRPHVVIDAIDGVALICEVGHYLAADQS